MPTPPHPRKRSVLVVDDDRDIVQTTRGNLELDGYEVLCAHDGRSGLELTRSHRPDLGPPLRTQGIRVELKSTAKAGSTVVAKFEQQGLVIRGISSDVDPDVGDLR